MSNSYCIDTNIIIDFWKPQGAFPRDVLQGLWEKFNEAISNQRIYSILDVYKEIMDEDKEDTELREWMKDNKSIFQEVDDCTVNTLAEIIKKYPLLASGHKNGADPVLVSYAKCKELVVLTNEGKSAAPSPYTPKIPNLCEEYNVRCVGVWEFCRLEGITLS